MYSIWFDQLLVLVRLAFILVMGSATVCGISSFLVVIDLLSIYS